MYSLLNYIAATSKDIYDSGSVHSHGYSLVSHGQSNLHSLESGLRGLSEDEKRLIGISTISAVTRLALEFKMEEAGRKPMPSRLYANKHKILGHTAHHLNAIATVAIC